MPYGKHELFLPGIGILGEWRLETGDKSGIIEALFKVLQQRKLDPPAGSYTARLLAAGEDEIIKKVGEEVVEVILAAKGQGNARLVEETADLLYHVLVLLVARDVQWQSVLEELARRRKPASDGP